MGQISVGVNKQALAYIEDAGFETLGALWPQRDGFQGDFDSGRAGSESSNPHLKQSAFDIEQAMLSCL